MSLSKVSALLEKKMTAKKWDELTAHLDGLSAKDLESALTQVEQAAASWSTHIDPAYFSSTLRPERHPSPKEDVEMRVCPKTWHRDVFEGNDSPRFSTIRVLLPHSRDRVKAAQLPNLLELSHMTELRYLRLDQVKLSAKFFKLMKKDHNLQSLTHVRFWYSDFKPMKASLLKAFIAAKLPDLSFLNLGQNYMGVEGASILAGASQFGALRELEVPNNSFGPEGVELLYGSPLIGQLEVLDLAINGMGDGVCEGLLSNLGSAMRTLNLESNELSGASARALAQASHLEALDTLNLSGNTLDSESVEELVRAPHLQNSLRCLELGEGFTSRVAQAMIDDHLLPNLEFIQAELRNEEAKEAVKLLQEARPTLAPKP